MLSVSRLISTKTGVAPRNTTAFAVDTKVNDGMMTSSPGARLHRSAAISSADVQDWVNSASPTPRRCFSHVQQILVAVGGEKNANSQVLKMRAESALPKKDNRSMPPATNGANGSPIAC